MYGYPTFREPNQGLGRPRKRHVFERKWELRVRDSKSDQRLTVDRREQVIELQRRHGNAVREIRAISFECREWIPFVCGYDEDAYPHVDYKKTAFKGPTQELAERKADEAFESALVSLPDCNGRPAVIGLFEDDYYRAIRLKKQSARKTLKRAKAAKVPTLSEWVERCFRLQEMDKTTKASSIETAKHYAKHLKDATIPNHDEEFYIEPFVIGDVDLDDLTMDHLREFVRSLGRKISPKTGQHLSPKTIENIIAVIATSWSRLRIESDLAHLAERLKFDRTVLPRGKNESTKIANVFTDEEIQALIDHARDDRERAFLGLALTGIRAPGEVAAVRWDDFFEHEGERFLRIERQVQKGQIQATKTNGSGDQVVPVPDGLWILIQSTETLKSGFVLPSFENTNEPISTKTLQDRFDRLRKRAGTIRADLRMYDLRATAITKYRQHAPPDTVRRIAGHATTAMLDRHYDRNKNIVFVAGLSNVLPWGQQRQ